MITPLVNQEAMNCPRCGSNEFAELPNGLFRCKHCDCDTEFNRFRRERAAQEIESAGGTVVHGIRAFLKRRKDLMNLIRKSESRVNNPFYFLCIPVFCFPVISGLFSSLLGFEVGLVLGLIATVFLGWWINDQNKQKLKKAEAKLDCLNAAHPILAKHYSDYKSMGKVHQYYSKADRFKNVPKISYRTNATIKVEAVDACENCGSIEFKELAEGGLICTYCKTRYEDLVDAGEVFIQAKTERKKTIVQIDSYFAEHKRLADNLKKLYTLSLLPLIVLELVPLLTAIFTEGQPIAANLLVFGVATVIGVLAGLPYFIKHFPEIKDCRSQLKKLKEENPEIAENFKGLMPKDEYPDYM